MAATLEVIDDLVSTLTRSASEGEIKSAHATAPSLALRVGVLALGVLLIAPLAASADEPSATAAGNTAALRVPQGFVVELVAGPPLIERPMLVSFDDRGRLYVCDSAGVNERGPELAKNPPHKIRVLDDTDGDGRFDRSTVFADKMIFPQGIVWHAGSVYCSSPPSFWKLTDTDGDDHADVREELVTGFANTGVADDMHGGSLGPDGRIYWCAGRFPHEIHKPGGPVIHKGTAPLVLRCKPDGTDVEVVCGSQGNAVGVAFTSAGDMFASGTFLAPNSMGAGLRDAVIHCVDGGEYPVRDRVLNEHKRTGDLLPPMTHLGVSAASDLLLCRAGALGQGSRGDLFSAQFNLHKVLRHHVEPAGATFTCRNEDFLATDDADFHPTDVLEDADGSLLVVNTGGWFRIGCPTSQVAKPEVLGAIYRVRRAQPDATAGAPKADPRGLQLDWAALTVKELTALLSDEHFAVRDRAVAQLATHGDQAVRDVSMILLGNTANTEAKSAAVWALTRIETESARAAVRMALDDFGARGVRQALARSAGLHRDAAAVSRLSAMLATDDPAVRREAATALGRIGDKSAVPALLAGLNTAKNDRFLEHALIFALIQIDDRATTLAGLQSAYSPARRGALVALDQMDGGGLTPELVVPLLAPADPALQQTALWVIAHHGDWGRSMVDFFRGWLARGAADDDNRAELRRQLLAFASDASVQELVGQAVLDQHTPADMRLVLLEVIGQAGLEKLPSDWSRALAASLANPDERMVRQAIATVRTLPADKRPLVSRVDAKIDYPMAEKDFAGTTLAENFCVRWQGAIRCPLDTTYTFSLDSDDGSQLFIDGRRVVDNGGSHALREREDTVHLRAGLHELRLDFVQEEGEAACRLSWSFEGRAKEIVPAEALFHRPRRAGGSEHVVATEAPDSTNPFALEPGLSVRFYALGGRPDTFPDEPEGNVDELLAAVAADTARPAELRVQAAAAVAPRLQSVEPALFDFLIGQLGTAPAPLVRLDAADALSRARLDEKQLLALAGPVGQAGVLEMPRLVRAFEGNGSATVGQALVAALNSSPGLRGIQAGTLTAVLAAYPQPVRDQAAPLVDKLQANVEQQRARLASLESALAGGDIQRGRELFFANEKAICATCHAVQGQGGQIGPDLTKIGAIRTPRDLLEAVVVPSASFARGYEPFNIVTEDGQVLAGIIARETADAVHLVGTNRVETRVPRSGIETMAQSPVSIMPEGMDQQLSRQELADLIEFLHSLR
ncbi:MAG: PVC-type heme-binding CxxCH protein [Pirellulales bacterium]